MTEIKNYDIDASTIAISVDRGICNGRCPSYCLTLKSSGELTFKGRKYVNFIGVDQRAVAPDLVVNFAKNLLDLDFFDLPIEIHNDEKHLSTTILTLKIEERKHSVAVTGAMEGIGLQLELIATEIDKAVGSSLWIWEPIVAE